MKLTRHLSLVTVVLMTMLALAVLPSIASAAQPSVPQFSAGDSAMPQTTKRQDIVTEGKLRMALIRAGDVVTKADGSQYTFQTDIGKNAVGEWVTNYSEDELRAAEDKALISVFDLVRDREQEFPDQRSVLPSLPLHFRVYKLRDDVTPEELRKMLADMSRAAVTNRDTKVEDRTLNGLAVNMYPDSDGFELPKETVELEFGAVSFNVAHVVGPFEQ